MKKKSTDVVHEIKIHRRGGGGGEQVDYCLTNNETAMKIGPRAKNIFFYKQQIHLNWP